MLKKRLIFTLLVDNNNFMLSRNFRLQKVGDINWLLKNYKFESISSSIDELIILNVSKNEKSINSFLTQLDEISKHCTIPIAAGGLITNCNLADSYMKHGADKLVINNACFDNHKLVSDLVNTYGSQAIVAAVDWLESASGIMAYSNSGTIESCKLSDHLTNLVNLNIGEVYLNSIQKDGTGQGFNYDALSQFPNNWNKPIILAGGAGHYQHFLEAFSMTNVSAIATANLFNFVGNGLLSARADLIDNKVELANFYSLKQYI
jgi:cyclase